MSTATPFYNNLVEELDWSPEELRPKLDHDKLMAQHPTRLLDGDRIIDVLDLEECQESKPKKKAVKKAAAKKKGNNSNA